MPWKVISPRICRESATVLMEQLNQDHSITREIKVNWGNSNYESHSPHEVFGNRHEAVARSSNKRVMFNLLVGLGTVPVHKTEDTYSPHGYFIHSDPYGHNGSGVLFTNSDADVIEAVRVGHLVTCRIPGDEYRAYFAYGKVVDIYKKVRVEEDRGSASSPIHNSYNGWGYLSNATELDEVKGLKNILKEYTIKAANRIELSYGAVDFIYGQDGYVYILETNSAPTLIESELVKRFSDAIYSNLGE